MILYFRILLLQSIIISIRSDWMPRSLLRSINKNQVLSNTKLSYRFTTKLACHVNDSKPCKPQFLKEKDSKYFEHQRLEAEIYKWWEDSGYFQPPPFEQDENEPFVIPMPPPITAAAVLLMLALCSWELSRVRFFACSSHSEESSDAVWSLSRSNMATPPAATNCPLFDDIHEGFESELMVGLNNLLK